MTVMTDSIGAKVRAAHHAERAALTDDDLERGGDALTVNLRDRTRPRTTTTDLIRRNREMVVKFIKDPPR